MSDAPVLNGVMRVTDLDAASDFEKKHTPYVEAERADNLVRVHVRVGHYVAHPNQPDHFIESIDLIADGATVAHLDLSAVAAQPDVTFMLDVEPRTHLSAVESCNLHGVWAADFTTP